MPWRRLAPLLFAGLLLPWHGAPGETRLPADDAGLLDFFQQRTAHATPDNLRKLIEQLGDASFEVREQASDRLTAIGAPALPALARASTAPDAEVRRRADDCRHQIETAPDGPLVRATARLLAERKPTGAAAVLLDYLPARADEPTAEALRTALAGVAVRDGRPEPAVVRALTDESPPSRAAAGVALCRAGVKEQLPSVRKLLQDPEPRVRLRVGLALAELGDPEAVPALIGLLDVLPRNLLAPVEDLLYALARDKAPALAMGGDAASRRKFRDAWADWWKKKGGAADLRRAREPPLLDHTLVVLLDEGKMIDLDGDDRPAWELTDLGFPLDLQVLPGERVLVADHHGSRVVEHHHDGTVLWEKNVSGPLVAQRLPDGNTFIANQSELIEVDRAGTVVFSYVRPDGEEIMRAAKLPDGDIACVSGRIPRGQHFVRLDPSGREKSRFAVTVQTSGGRIDVQPDGRVLIPLLGENRVVEYDPTGKPLREFRVGQPIAALRLANGNTLITSMNEKRAVEFDPAGKVVWDYRANTRLNRAWRR
ncbi:MAG TPA: HEAT repeat domain-containing protein [Gemmataceae bacterium]|nr:HEAT repeat domain-containing protein [Gemmataceae bacterium]